MTGLDSWICWMSGPRPCVLFFFVWNRSTFPRSLVNQWGQWAAAASNGSSQLQPVIQASPSKKVPRYVGHGRQWIRGPGAASKQHQQHHMYKAAAVIIIATGNRGHMQMRCLPMLSQGLPGVSLGGWDAGSCLLPPHSLSLSPFPFSPPFCLLAVARSVTSGLCVFCVCLHLEGGGSGTNVLSHATARSDRGKGYVAGWRQ